MSVNSEADALINGDRQAEYGSPLDNFTRVAHLWQEVFNAPVTPEQVALCLLLLKVSRFINTPTHRDSVVDMCGYAGCIELIWDEQLKRKATGRDY